MEQLKVIKASSTQDIVIHQGNANAILPDIVREIDWTNKRGLVFFDPFGMQLDWSTLEIVFNAGLIDVWILFPVHGIRRQLANSPENVTPEAENRLNHFLVQTNGLKFTKPLLICSASKGKVLEENVKSRITDSYLKKLRRVASYVRRTN